MTPAAPPTKVYLSELQGQVETIKGRLLELEDLGYQGVFSKPYTPETKAEYFSLKARLKEVQNAIINYKP